MFEDDEDITLSKLMQSTSIQSVCVATAASTISLPWIFWLHEVVTNSSPTSNTLKTIDECPQVESVRFHWEYYGGTMADA